jgi:hypothetical protein
MNKIHFISKTVFYLFIALITTCFVASCNDDSETNAPDVSHIKVDVKLRRFEQALFAIDTNQIEAGAAALAQQYPLFFPIFAGQIIHDQSNPKETPILAVRNFITTPQVRHLYDTVQQLYGDLRWLESDLSQMFRYYQYYFPKKPIPEVVTMISVYATDAFTVGDSLCGIGLDMFLGENHPDYLSFENTAPAYLRRQFRREYIPIRLAKAITQNTLSAPSGERLLDQMLQNGKQLYLVDCLLPEVADSLKMGYTREQWEGCLVNEQGIWARMLDEKMLYSTDSRRFRKLVSPSPNAPVVFQEAPGEVGNWIGWQIVKAWVKRNPNASMEEMLQQRDAQKFLQAAKYKPKRQ